jgi:uncharacterized protein
MEMQGQRQLAVTQQQAWDALNDPAILKQCVAGCDVFEPTDETHFNVGMGLKIGPVSAKFSGKIELTDVQQPHHYQLNFEGQGGAAGFGKGQSKVTLTPNELGTLLDYTVNAQVGGKIAQLGQRLIDGVSKSMADDFFKRFDVVLQERYPSDVSSSGEPTSAGGSNEAQNALGGTDGNKSGDSSSNTNAATEAAKASSGIPVWLWLVIGVSAGYLVSRFF